MMCSGKAEKVCAMVIQNVAFSWDQISWTLSYRLTVVSLVIVHPCKYPKVYIQ